MVLIFKVVGGGYYAISFMPDGLPTNTENNLLANNKLGISFVILHASVLLNP